MDKKYLTIAAPSLPPAGEAQLDGQRRQVRPRRRGMAVTLVIYLIIIPAVVLAGVFLFKDRKYDIVALAIAFLACVPFFTSFEHGRAGARELVVIAVMTAISVLGRLIFAPLPGFKPVTAVVVITAIAFGPQAGFITGAMSAVVSNIFYGQGPWTPFQMFVWGFLGLLSGLIFKRGQKPAAVLLILSGIVGGVLFSVMMDVWSVLNIDGTWNTARYWALLASSLPFMAVYALSNVVFLLALTKPFLAKLNRVKTKYGLFGE